MLSQKQEFELITSIKATGEIPLKFAYLDKGAENWFNISNLRANSKNTINSNESVLLKKRIQDIISTYDLKDIKLNIIDLGCGTGEPILPILDYLKENNIVFRYVPIDISNSMLNLAKNNISKKFDVEILPINIDFEQGQFSDIIYTLKKDGFNNLLCFLGSTLGNHFNRERVLTNIRDSMGSDDYMLLGVELSNIYKTDNIINKYKITGAYNFVMFVPHYLGIKDDQVEYNVAWNILLNQVEQTIYLKDDIYIEIGSEKIKLEKDDFLLIGRSYKFTMGSIVQILQDTGFRVELLMTSLKKDYLITLIQPSRY
ncbi:L-histidine N(alpha)-methyltransferase [archaeon]|nr:L-histidine N(alpha)-methyltransferase [archaeon]NCP79280.1 L-histidine N(alpha)-methyltransferase [archaeon]NCP98261.1 L-histidine N(alpha)-methyltransferase [archaeon]NCQ07047.1 L-histidine N(alpha)-methyltransferase [archaeon]NCQ50843.1 L-histidine N(alpha)-methyltransferase [archaeon]